MWGFCMFMRVLARDQSRDDASSNPGGTGVCRKQTLGLSRPNPGFAYGKLPGRTVAPPVAVVALQYSPVCSQGRRRWISSQSQRGRCKDYSFVLQCPSRRRRVPRRNLADCCDVRHVASYLRRRLTATVTKDFETYYKDVIAKKSYLCLKIPKPINYEVL